ncbi:MAG: type III-A CRISPR-associated RAMP protein Csm4 [Tissierellales bacterium]|nr:type III-A CRISPR-associated RAMP protein Csm4 [Tissierellales bacterium]
MGYYIYKLKFNTGVHFGLSDGSGLEKTDISFPSDAFFSAILSEAVKLYGTEKLNKYVDIIEKGDFLVSDLMPFKEYDLYIPKPYVFIEKEKNGEKQNSFTSDKKKLKKIKYIPIEKIDSYFNYLSKGGEIPLDESEFGDFNLFIKNSIDDKREEDTRLYSIETFHFSQDSGLYFILKCPDEVVDEFENILNSLGTTGIGGKKSSGYGKFSLFTDPMELYFDDDFPIESNSDLIIKKDLKKEGKYYMLLSSYKPEEEEIERLKDGKSFYSIFKRSGFVTRRTYSENPQKRKEINMLKSGSVLDYKPKGEVVDLNLHGNHSIYRVGKPIVIGVDFHEKQD